MTIHRFFESLPAIRRGASDSRFRCAFVCIAARLFRVPAFAQGRHEHPQRSNIVFPTAAPNLLCDVGVGQNLAHIF